MSLYVFFVGFVPWSYSKAFHVVSCTIFVIVVVGGGGGVDDVLVVLLVVFVGGGGGGWRCGVLRE